MKTHPCLQAASVLRTCDHEIKRYLEREKGCFVNPKLNDKMAVVVSLAGVGLALYWMFTYSGPYRFLAELQLKWFGWYVPKLTVIVIAMGFLGIAALAKVLFRGAERPAPSMPQANTGTNPGAGVAAKSSDDRNVLLLSPYLRLWFLVIPLGMGAYFYFNATQAGELQQLQVQDFDGGRVKSRVIYADVRGHLSRNYMMKDDYMYIPMLDSAAPGPAHVLIGVDKKQTKTYLQMQSDGMFVVRGMVQRDLEGDVRVAFEKDGIPLAQNCWVVHTGRDPRGDRMIGLIVIGLTAVFGVGFGGWLIHRNKRRLTAAQPVQV